MKIFLLGFMGSGKSHWARKLSKSLGLPLWDLDIEIEKEMGFTIAEIFTHKGEDHFRELERDHLHHIVNKTSFMLSCGGGTPCFFDNMKFMNENGLTVWLDAPVQVMANRLKRKKHKRPLLKGLDDDQLTAFVTQRLEERRSFYEQSQLIIDPVKYTVTSLTEKIRSCTNLI